MSGLVEHSSALFKPLVRVGRVQARGASRDVPVPAAGKLAAE